MRLIERAVAAGDRDFLMPRPATRPTAGPTAHSAANDAHRAGGSHAASHQAQGETRPVNRGLARQQSTQGASQPAAQLHAGLKPAPRPVSRAVPGHVADDVLWHEDDYVLEPAQPSAMVSGFSLDHADLARQGLLSPTKADKRLALEMRAIRRRLLRRLNFYRRDSGRVALPSAEPMRNTVLFTSARPSEGKTFNALNLALSLAVEDNISVVLVDADVPRPKVFHHLGLKGGQGLTDYLLDPTLPLSSLIHRERSFPLSVMGQGQNGAHLAGDLGTGISPVELFAGAEMAAFVEELSERYPDSIIIFDAPPVLATPEAVILSRYVDEVVFVTEANRTPENAVAVALDELLDNNENVSLILNKCLAPEALAQYGSYEAYYNRQPSGRTGRER